MIENCADCEHDASVIGHEFRCTSCDDGLDVYGDGQLCVDLADNCNVVNPYKPENCLECISGYELDQTRTQCKPCSELTDDEYCDTCYVTPISLRWAA